MYMLLNIHLKQSRANNSFTRYIFRDTLAQVYQKTHTREFTASTVYNSEKLGGGNPKQTRHSMDVEQRKLSHIAGGRVNWYQLHRTIWQYQIKLNCANPSTLQFHFQTNNRKFLPCAQ